MLCQLYTSLIDHNVYRHSVSTKNFCNVHLHFKIPATGNPSNPEPPTLAAGALATELRPGPHSHPGNFTPALRVIDNPIPKLMLKESTGIITVNYQA